MTVAPRLLNNPPSLTPLLPHTPLPRQPTAYSLLALIHPGPRRNSRGVLGREGVLGPARPKSPWGVLRGRLLFFLSLCQNGRTGGRSGRLFQLIWIQNAIRPDNGRETSPQIGSDRQIGDLTPIGTRPGRTYSVTHPTIDPTEGGLYIRRATSGTNTPR